MTTKNPTGLGDKAPPLGRADGGLRTIDVNEILGGEREVVIAHQGERYRLRLTQNGKLLLTK